MAYILKPDEETAKLFSDKTRLKILELLTEKELTNSQLAALLNLSKPTISHHMKLLLNAAIVEISRIEHEEHGIAMKFYAVNPDIISSTALKKNPVLKNRDYLIMKQTKKEIQEAIAGQKGNIREPNIAFLRLLKSSMLGTGIEMDKPFYDTGYTIGANVVSKQIKDSKLEDVLKELADMWDKLKLGTIEFAGENKIRVKDCYQCEHMPDVGKTLCPSDAGIIAGVLDKTIGRRHSVKETKCWGTGYNFCEFEIEEL